MAKAISLEELPPVLRAQDIADYLKMSRNKVYELYDMPIEMGGIPNMRIGNGRRTIKEDFFAWMEEKKKEQRDLQDRRYALICGDKKGAKKVG